MRTLSPLLASCSSKDKASAIMSDMGAASARTCVLIILPAHMKPSLNLYTPSSHPTLPYSFYGISLQILERKLPHSVTSPSSLSLSLFLSLPPIFLSFFLPLAYFLIRLWSKLLGISLLCPVSRLGKEEQQKKASWKISTTCEAVYVCVCVRLCVCVCFECQSQS